MGFEGIGSCKTLLSHLETASSKVKGGILCSTLKLAVLMSIADHIRLLDQFWYWALLLN
jgi:hypothetical protein